MTEKEQNIVTAAVNWQLAESRLRSAQQDWLNLPTRERSIDNELWEVYKRAEQVRDGHLAQLALFTRHYIKTEELT